MPEMKQDRIALDRAASARTIDPDGHMRVLGSAVSKANVCGYAGSEIPDYEALGLQADRIYQLYRDAASLEAAAASLNGKPLLIVHKPQTAADHDHELVVGSLDNARWDAPYVRADLTVWDQSAIDLIRSGEQRQLSCAYRYVPVMESGTAPDGQKFDGVMTQIFFNHCAVVSEGRAGPDVFVGDSALPKPPKEKPAMVAKSAVALSRKALLASGALRAYLQPKLAADAKLDLSPVLKGVTAKNWKASKPKIKTALDAATNGKLAADADIEDVVEMLDRLDDVTDEIADVVEPTAAVEPVAEDDDAETLARLREVLKAKGMSDEDIAAVCAALNTDAPAAAATPAQDTEKDDKDVPEKKPEVTKAAMDAAIAAAARAAEQSTIARLNGIREAEKAVRPWIGEIAIAQDSAEAVYKLALDSLGVEVTGVHPSAFAAILKAQPKPGEAVTQRTAAPAMDSAAATAYAERFPNAARLKH